MERIRDFIRVRVRGVFPRHRLAEVSGGQRVDGRGGAAACRGSTAHAHHGGGIERQGATRSHQRPPRSSMRARSRTVKFRIPDLMQGRQPRHGAVNSTPRCGFVDGTAWLGVHDGGTPTRCPNLVGVDFGPAERRDAAARGNATPTKRAECGAS